MKKTIKILTFLALAIAMLVAAPQPAKATGLTITGYHDDGSSGGNHYFEIYFESTDPNEDCWTYSGTDGSIAVWYSNDEYQSGGSWVLAWDGNQSYSGPSGFSHHECQVNVYAPTGTGLRRLDFRWSENGTTQPGTVYYTVTF